MPENEDRLIAEGAGNAAATPWSELRIQGLLRVRQLVELFEVDGVPLALGDGQPAGNDGDLPVLTGLSLFRDGGAGLGGRQASGYGTAFR